MIEYRLVLGPVGHPPIRYLLCSTWYEVLKSVPDFVADRNLRSLGPEKWYVRAETRDLERGGPWAWWSTLPLTDRNPTVEQQQETVKNILANR